MDLIVQMTASENRSSDDWLPGRIEGAPLSRTVDALANSARVW
jgi:hypothetical protein